MDTTAVAAAVNPTVAYVTEKIGAGLAALAESLKVPASEVWRILVTQAALEGRLYLAVCGLILGLWAAMAVVVPKIARYEKEREGEIFDTCAGSGFTAVVTLILFLKCLWSGITMTANPEYYALQEILRVF